MLSSIYMGETKKIKDGVFEKNNFFFTRFSENVKFRKLITN